MEEKFYKRNKKDNKGLTASFFKKQQLIYFSDLI